MLIKIFSSNGRRNNPFKGGGKYWATPFRAPVQTRRYRMPRVGGSFASDVAQNLVQEVKKSAHKVSRKQAIKWLKNPV